MKRGSTARTATASFSIPVRVAANWRATSGRSAYFAERRSRALRAPNCKVRLRRHSCSRSHHLRKQRQPPLCATLSAVKLRHPHRQQSRLSMMSLTRLLIARCVCQNSQPLGEIHNSAITTGITMKDSQEKQSSDQSTDNAANDPAHLDRSGCRESARCRRSAIRMDSAARSVRRERARCKRNRPAFNRLG